MTKSELKKAMRKLITQLEELKSEADNLAYEAEKDAEIETMEAYADALDSCVTEITSALEDQ